MEISLNIANTLKAYMDSILKVNENINLTRITDLDSFELLNLEDSLAIIDEFNNAPEGKYIDLGSGAGLPGIPLAIVSRRNTTLIDSVKKKMIAVNEVIDELGLENINTVGERIEDFSIAHPNEYSVITARAVASIPSLLELASPLMKIGAHLILMKSRELEPYDEDKTLDKLGLKNLSSREYYLSDDETFRTVLVFEKVKEPSVKLPRRIGMAQKRPLVKL